MEWIDEGIVLGTRRHGEGNAILELMTRAHGRHLGLVRGGAGTRLRPLLQPGNSVSAVWRARLDEHLGNYTVEGLRMRAALLLAHSHAVFGIAHLAGLCRLLPERDPHPAAHDVLAEILDAIDDPLVVAARIARFELGLLLELGFGLDLAVCAASGRRNDLVYVSPKSGRALSRDAGAPWRDRLLRLPAFLASGDGFLRPTRDDLADGFALTGYFLTRHVYGARGMNPPPARDSFIASILRERPAVADAS
jgi:DNA repair protein RecO (recombination protein O)